MVEEKGLPEAVADRIGEYVRLNGSEELVEKLLADPALTKVKSAVEGLEAMKLMLKYSRLLGAEKNILFDLSLARGLDYYTGIIYEAILLGKKNKRNVILLLRERVLGDSSVDGGDVSVGSIAGGGRYDNLVGMFDTKHKKVPCVGVSVGIERIFAVIENKLTANSGKVRTTEVEVFVASAQKNLLEHRMSLCKELWEEGFKVTKQMFCLSQACNKRCVVFRSSSLIERIRSCSISYSTARSSGYR